MEMYSKYTLPLDFIENDNIDGYDNNGTFTVKGGMFRQQSKADDYQPYDMHIGEQRPLNSEYGNAFMQKKWTDSNSSIPEKPLVFKQNDLYELYPQSMANTAGIYKVAQNSFMDTKMDVRDPEVNYSLYGDGFSKEFIDEMINDREFNNILNEYIIPNEGGLVDRPNDRGKLTKFGISKNTYKDEDISNLTRERSNAIIYRDFYKWNGLNKLPYPIRGFVVDYGMPTSPLNAIKTVHRVLDLPPGGNIIGSATLENLKNFSQKDYEDFLVKYKRNMEDYYKNIVLKDETQAENLKGWLNRVNRAHIAR